MAVNNLRALGYRQHTCSDNPCRAIKKKALSLSHSADVQAFTVTKEIQTDADLLVYSWGSLIFFWLSGTNRKSMSWIKELRCKEMRETSWHNVSTGKEKKTKRDKGESETRLSYKEREGGEKRGLVLSSFAVIQSCALPEFATWDGLARMSESLMQEKQYTSRV